MRLIKLCLALVIFCVLSIGGAEAACKPSGNVRFQDQFDVLAPAWGSYQNYHVANGKLVIQPPAGYNTSTINNNSLYDDVDICVEMTVSPPVMKGNCGGIIFWAADYDNYYTVQISTDGQASVWRRQKGKWLSQVAQQDFSAVRKLANQVNEIRVVTTGSKAKLFVNGKLFKEISGQPPEGGSEVGLIGCSPSNVSAPVAFDNFVVSAPPGAPAVAVAKPGEFPPGAVPADCRANDKALFQDSFKDLAASWGTLQNYHVESGKLVIQPPAGYTTATINNAALYDDIDVCASMNVPTLVKNNCGGIVFWASDYDNYYSLEVTTDGQASAWRWQRGKKWLSQMDWTNLSAVHAAANQPNVLRVQTAGSRARFYINGVLFGEITGEPPQGGSQVGLMACSPDNASARVEFANFVISPPGGGGSSGGGVVADSGAVAVTADCKATGKTQFQDSFKELAASWGTSDNYHVEAGKLVIQPPAGYNTATINNASLYDDVDVCAEMNVPTLVKNNCGGVIFWGIDYDNYYSLQVSTDGQASIWRRQKGKWLNQADWQDFAAVHAAANQINTLRVVTSGNKAQFFVNGKLFKELTGQPPDGGSQVGLLACSPDNASARTEFTNFVVSTPGGAAPVEPKVAPPAIVASASGEECQAPRDALFTDKFATLQASWGTYENYKVDNGEFLITPPAGYNTTAINTASLYDDIDLCVGMKARAPVGDGTCGALVFWAEDYDNYYSFQVSTSGQASFWRRQRGKWLNQVGWQAADGVNTGDGFNQLHVVTAGRNAKLLINGKLFKEVEGQPPAGGQQIGLMACAPDKQAGAVGFDNIVVAAPAGSGGATKVAENKADDKVVEKKTDDKVVEKKTDDKVAENKTDDKKIPDDEGITAPEGRRVALVIGIGAYKAVPELPNPPRDAADIASELSAIGFDVTHIDNLDALSMRKALREFEQKADGASIAIVYYAGHGMEVNGVNYLIPVDAQLNRDTDIEDEAISLNRVLSAVEGAHDLRLVLLDACRNNPFASKMAHADGTRAVTRGLARIEPGSSTLVAFSAKEGTTAEDGNGKNSPFASALLANLDKRGLEISFLFRRVRDQVMSETGNRQEPFVYGSLSAVPIYLAGK